MNHNTILFTHKGVEQENCKDVCQFKDLENATIISLADGVSSKKRATLGASKVQTDIALMLANETELSNLSDEQIGYRIANTICKSIDCLAENKKCEKTDFASTLMMGIFPEQADFYWTIHIGDGIIGIVDKNEDIKVLSAPQNGITKQYTYTTVSKDLFKKIRVKKYNERGSVFFMTDGITNEIFKEEKSRKEYVEIIKKTDWSGLEKRLLDDGARDDIGFCCIEF